MCKIGIDYILCPICNTRLKRIHSNGHLLKHNMNLEEFKQKYPNQKLVCKKYSDMLKALNKRRIVTEETRRKISNGNKGNPAWNKGLTKHTDNRVKASGEATSTTRRKKLKSGELIHNSIGSKRSIEARLRMRNSRLVNVNRNGGTWPSYSDKAIKYFKEYDVKNKTKGQYATNPYEYYIKSLRYWLDYINFENKIIMEYDEEEHFLSSGKLRSKDIIRQNKIQNLYKDFKFIRISGRSSV